MPANKTAAASIKTRRSAAARGMTEAEFARIPALWATFDRAAGKLTGETFTWRSEAEDAAQRGPVAVDGLFQLIAVALDDRGVARNVESAPSHNEHMCVLADRVKPSEHKPVSLEQQIAELRKAHAARLASTLALKGAQPAKLRRVK